MAYAVTHVVLTKKLYNRYFKDKDRKELFIGTCFPDIRHLAGIHRDATHFHGISLAEVMSEDPFMAGVIFHSYVDDNREAYVRAREIYKLAPESEYIIHALKFFEDQMLYEKIQDWNEYVGFFDEILKGELGFGMSKETVREWHSILQEYLSQKPNGDCLVRMFRKVGRTKEMAEAVSRLAEELKQDDRMIIYVEDLYREFE